MAHGQRDGRIQNLPSGQDHVVVNVGRGTIKPNHQPPGPFRTEQGALCSRLDKSDDAADSAKDLRRKKEASQENLKSRHKKYMQLRLEIGGSCKILSSLLGNTTEARLREIENQTYSGNVSIVDDIIKRMTPIAEAAKAKKAADAKKAATATALFMSSRGGGAAAAAE